MSLCEAAFGSRIVDLGVRQTRARLLASAVLAGKVLAAPWGLPVGMVAACCYTDEGHISGLSSEGTNMTVVAILVLVIIAATTTVNPLVEQRGTLTWWQWSTARPLLSLC